MEKGAREAHDPNLARLGAARLLGSLSLGIRQGLFFWYRVCGDWPREAGVGILGWMKNGGLRRPQRDLRFEPWPRRQTSGRPEAREHVLLSPGDLCYLELV